MTKKIIHIPFLAVLLTACTQTPDIERTVRECTAMPVARACATAFAVDDKVYVFAGRDSSGVAQNDLWCYSTTSDSWTSLGATPLSPRVNATACVKDGRVFIGLGFKGKYNDDNSYLRDFWAYDPATNTWTRLADYPNHYTDRATSFTGDGELYVGYGFSLNYRRDMFRYTMATNRWDSIDVQVGFHGYPTRSFGGTGCTCRNRHFMGSGYYKSSLKWWAELVDGTHWERRTPVPGRERTLAASAATKNYIYVCGGMHYGGVNTTGEVLQDIRRYDPDTDRWQYVAIMPQRLFNHICVAIGNTIYWGLGENEDFQVNKRMYCIEE